jgi:hypothetical protein
VQQKLQWAQFNTTQMKHALERNKKAMEGLKQRIAKLSAREAAMTTGGWPCQWHVLILTHCPAAQA